ncbi:MAG: TonB-dependent receptor, partial [Cyanobacteria bacterium J06632_22]
MITAAQAAEFGGVRSFESVAPYSQSDEVPSLDQVYILSEADNVTDALIDDGIPPAQTTPGTADGFIDEAVIESTPAELPQLVQEQLGDDLVLRVAPLREASISADGRSTLLVGGTITDASGQPIQNDVVVTLTSSAGDFIGADYDIDRAGFQVLARLGEFEAELQSSLDSQRVTIRASADAREALGLLGDDETAQAPAVEELQAYTQVSFITPVRPSMVTGAVDFRLGPATTDLWGSYRDFLDPSQMGQTDADLSAFLFLTGNVGEWLLTGAYNSGRALNERCDGNRLYRDVQACDQTHPVYGDSSTTDFLTPSIDSVYVRLQRDSPVENADSDYIMWGDYSTDEFARFSQDFTAVSRQLHGFKGNYTFGNGLQLTALFANNIRPFQRDTIVPDGTSGFYFLSERLILPGSEDIFLETEELNRPGTVVDRVRLSRGADYQIDYDRGAILFNQPVSAIDANPFGPSLVRRIVATYQVDGEETGGTLVGARAQYNLSYDLESPSWVGATLMSEDQGAQDFTLAGLDALIPLGDSAQLVAELARSSFDDAIGNNTEGTAYRLEASGQISPDIGGTAYFRSAESGFRNDATSSFRPGQTRWGGQIGANLTDTTQLQFQVDQEINRGPVSSTSFNPFSTTSTSSVDNTLTTLRAGLQQQFGVLTTNFDFTHRDRTDRLNNDSFSSNQLGAGLTWPLAENLTFRAQTDVTLGATEDPLYPSETAFGIDWDVLPEFLTLRLAQRFFHGSTVLPDSVTSLDTLINYDVTDNTALRGRYSVLGGFNGFTGEGSLGLDHRILLAPGLHVDLGYERVFGSDLGEFSTGLQSSQAFALGQTASTLGLINGNTYTLGIEYTDNSAFQASARFQHRNSDSNGNNTVLTASAAGRISPALTTLARFEYANYANQDITGLLGNTSSINFGLAYRDPSSDKFNALFSYEYAVNPSITLGALNTGTCRRTPTASSAHKWPLKKACAHSSHPGQY